MLKQRLRRSRPWSRFAGVSLAAGASLAMAGCGQAGDVPAAVDAPLAEQHAPLLAQVTSFGSNPGNLQMFRHVPSGMPDNAPLVVVMHGCTQKAAGMEGSGWSAAADVYKFYVVYPQQQSGNNMTSCFNWFEPGDIARDRGEALSIKQMVDTMKATYSIDPARVYVAGFSAGAYMVPALLAAYPDVFSGGAIHSGGPYRCASSMTEGFSCMSPGVNRTPAAWGDLVRGAYPGYAGPRPRVTLWHGTSDYTVNVMNLTEAMEQWTNVHGIDQTPDTVETVSGFPHKVYRDEAGQALVETWELTGMGHAVAMDAQFQFPGGTAACGAVGAYLSDVNLCSVYHQARFFGLTEEGSPTGDTTPPTVNVTSPARGATVSGTVDVTADAADAVGVTRVEFLVNGEVVATDTQPPYAFAWNTTAVSNGQHTLGARAFDAAGNQATDTDTVVTVSNSGSPVPVTVQFTSIVAEDGYLKANADGGGAALGLMTNLALGRGVDGKYNRSFLSFDTSGLPDGATVTRAFLTVSYASGSGDPWSTPAGNTLVIDVKTGTFNAANTEAADWAASATADGVAAIDRFSAGTKSSGDFSGEGLSAINTLGKTQLRLRFTQAQAATQYLFVRDGANAVLTVVYTP